MYVFLQAVQLHASVVIDVQVTFLGHSKHHFIVQEPTKRENREETVVVHNMLHTAHRAAHWTSLTVSLTWNSHPKCLSFQSMVAI